MGSIFAWEKGFTNDTWPRTCIRLDTFALDTGPTLPLLFSLSFLSNFLLNLTTRFLKQSLPIWYLNHPPLISDLWSSFHQLLTMHVCQAWAAPTCHSAMTKSLKQQFMSSSSSSPSSSNFRLVLILVPLVLIPVIITGVVSGRGASFSRFELHATVGQSHEQALSVSTISNHSSSLPMHTAAKVLLPLQVIFK